jgi:hypothetical protein
LPIIQCPSLRKPCVGKLVAEELLGGTAALLEPFRFSRYAEGRLHPTSHSPFPWS